MSLLSLRIECTQKKKVISCRKAVSEVWSHGLLSLPVLVCRHGHGRVLLLARTVRASGYSTASLSKNGFSDVIQVLGTSLFAFPLISEFKDSLSTQAHENKSARSLQYISFSNENGTQMAFGHRSGSRKFSSSDFTWLNHADSPNFELGVEL